MKTSERKEHNDFAKMVLKGLSKKYIDEVNAYIDRPVKWLGSRHRVLNHSSRLDRMDTQMLLALYGYDAYYVQMLHILLDKDKQLQRMMELMEMMKDGH